MDDVEVMARALFDDEHDTPSILWKDADNDEKTAWRKSAQAALAALEAEGRVVVPVGFVALMQEMADDIEAEVEAKRGTVLLRTTERDLDIVRRARAMIEEASNASV